MRQEDACTKLKEKRFLVAESHSNIIWHIICVLYKSIIRNIIKYWNF